MVTTHSAAAYDAIAEWYYRELSASWIHQTALPALLDLVREEMRGQQRVCDIGCGTGILSRALAREGAIVVGIDLSSRLLQFAQEEETARPLGITYLQADAHALHWHGDLFRMVVSNLALLDMEDLSAVAQTISCLLQPGGILAFSILHPCGPYSTPEQTLAYWDYYQEGFHRSENLHSVRGRVGTYHRRLETYFQVLASAGLMLEAMREPRPQAPNLVAYRSVPALLLMRWRKKACS